MFLSFLHRLLPETLLFDLPSTPPAVLYHIPRLQLKHTVVGGGEGPQTFLYNCSSVSSRAVRCPISHGDHLLLDAEGVSSLGWLLGQYLEQRESSRNPLSRAASFASRVRRLCHLLVHVEPPPGPSEPSTQPQPRKSPPGSSPVGVTLPTALLWAFPGVSTQDPETRRRLR